MRSIVPNLAVKDIEETVEYYQINFGFTLQMAVDISKDGFDTQLEKNKEYIWAMIVKDDIAFMLQSEQSIKEDIGGFYQTLGASLSLYIDVEDVEKFYDKVKDKVDIYKPLETTWYGQKEFYIKDINGYILGFSSRA